MLRDETDMLEVRLAESERWPVEVAAHILIEATTDHRGNPKPLHYAENKDRFSEWSDKIVHVAADLPPGDAWYREHWQRSQVWAALDDLGARDDDVLMMCDVDEFPPDEAFERLPDPVLAHRQNLAMYAVDWLYPHQMRCSVTCRVGYRRGGDATSIRDARDSYPVADGGWHITWLGGVGGQRAKLSATCHTEMTQAEYDRIWNGDCYERGVHHSGTCMMVPADVDETWPKLIRERKVPASWFRPRPRNHSTS